MTVETIVDISREAMFTALVVAALPLAVALLVGVAGGMLQAVTQVQDPTIALVPKFLAVFCTLALCLPWLIERMMEYSQVVFSSLLFVGGSGW